MDNIKLFLAAATLLAGSVSMLRAESMARSLTDASVRGASFAPAAAASGDAAMSAPAEPLSPVVEIAARDVVEDQPQVVQAQFNPSAPQRSVLPVRPIAHRARARSSCAHCYHRPARVAKRAGQAHLAELRATVWRGAPGAAQLGHSWPIVVLGVGY